MGTQKNGLRRLFSGMRLHQKFRVLEFVTLGLVLLMNVLLVLSVLNAEVKKEEALERTVLSATEHYSERLLESTVSVARSVYINDDLYTFLNTRYHSSTEYFEAFHEIRKNSPLILADNNEVISGCTVYTKNPSIMNGSRIQKVSSVEEEDWYRLFVRLGKNTILHCDQENGTLSLIRKLDYVPTRFESILKLDISMAPLHTYCESLSFEGSLYILSGGTVLYSSETDAQLPDVGHDFAASAANYYTADVEFYANAAHKPPMQFLREHWAVPAVLLLSLAVLGIVGGSLASETQRRAAQAIVAASREGGLDGLTEQDYGKDEIGDLVRTSIAFSGRLDLANDRLTRTRDALQREKASVQTLLRQALYLEAAADVQRLGPALAAYCSGGQTQTLRAELTAVSLVAEHFSASVSLPEDVPDVQVPALLFADLTKTLLSEQASVRITVGENEAVLHAVRKDRPPQRWALFINAVFEEGEPRESFRVGDPLNPYLRLHCYGAKANAEPDGTLTVRLPISNRKET